MSARDILAKFRNLSENDNFCPTYAWTQSRGLAAAGGVRGCAVRGVSGCSVVSYQYLVIMQNL